MRFAKVKWSVAWALLGCVAGAQGGEDDLKSVEQKLAAAWSKPRTLSAKVRVTETVDIHGAAKSSTCEGTLELMQKGDEFLARLERTTRAIAKMGEHTMRFEEKQLRIADGEAEYVVNESMGRKMVHKQKPQTAEYGDPTAVLAELRREHTLKLLPAGAVAGRDAYTIEARPKSERRRATEPARVLLHFDQETGLLVKRVGYDAHDKEMSTLTLTDLELDARIKPERFTFKAPDGIPVIDQTTR
jgi:outer membrane lipoprotein-sorting protein